jgi:superfamily II DNA helicase RecQ
MPFHVFQFPLPGDANLAELNACLQSRRIVSVTHQVIQSGGAALLVFVVQSAGGETAGSAASGASRPDAQRIDYRETLDAPSYALFSKLREERQKLADAEGVPVYTVFSNAHLAAFVTRGVKSKADMSAIGGIGQGRVDKYGERFLALLAESSAVAAEPRS